MEITFETEETLIIRQSLTILIMFCPDCQASVEMAMPQTIADLYGCAEREIFRLIESGAIHFVEGERVFVCRDSVLACLRPPTPIEKPISD